MPVQASSIAPQIDHIFKFVFGATVILAFIIFALLIFFCVRYRAQAKVNRVVKAGGQRIFEVIWILIPLVLTMFIFGFSARAYYNLYVPPRDAIDVYVIAKQWMWRFYGPGGVAEIGRLHVPVNKPVRLIMTSEDVIHSFFVPDFRVKQDVLPSRYTSLWFTPTQIGQFHVLCTQYCGMNHAAMDAWIEVTSAEDYTRWHQARAAEHGQDPQGYLGRGRQIYARYGCVSCHGDGEAASPVAGPTLNGLFGAGVTLNDGTTVVADENYLRESIYQPNNKIVKGYKPIMPSYAGQISEGEMVELINYLRALGGHR